MERCPLCSFDPTSLNDYCAKHRPQVRATQANSKEAVGEAGARLRALVAKWRAKADEMCPVVIPGAKFPRDGWTQQQSYDRTLGAVLATCADELDALLSAHVVSPPQEHSTRFVWLMERRLSRDSGLLGAVAAGTLVYWDGGHAESFTTDANKAVQWPSEAAAKAQCPPEHYEQWGWRYVEHGFIAVPVVTQEGE